MSVRNLRPALLIPLAFALSRNLPSQAAAQTPAASDALLDSLFRANRHPIALTDGRITGPGARFLTDVARSVQFFTIAESHNIAEVPQFTSALFTELRPAGDFRYYAVEQGPVVMRMLSQGGVRGADEATLGVARRYPHAFQFWNDQELLAMAAIGRTSPSRLEPLWGLDQEFGALHVLDLLSPLASAGSRTLVDSLRSRARPIESQRPFSVSGSLTRFISSTDSSEFDRLRASVAPRPGSESEQLIDALELSNRVYTNNRAAGAGQLTGYRSNNEREHYMKRNFMRHYRAAQRAGDTLPRVLLRVGNVHGGNWLSQTNVHALGSFVSEFAIANDMQAFNMLTWLINEPGTFWTLTESAEHLALANVGSTKEWFVVDFRPLRPFVHAGRLPTLSAQLRQSVFAFDAVLLIGSGTRGTYERLRGAR